MTTLVEPGPFRDWRISRVVATLTEVATACGEPTLTRENARKLADQLQEAALVVADLYVCPTCEHPEVGACTVCPEGRKTARLAPDSPAPR